VTAGEDTAEQPAVVGLVVPDRSDERSLWHPLVVLPELAWMLALVFGYSLARLFVVDPGTGYRNAVHLWAVERALHLPSEAGLQQAVLHWPALLRVANEYYASAHFPLTAVFLFWVYVFRHDAWRWVRNAMTVFTATSLILEALLPMAPPRLVPAFGMVDTGVALGQSVYPAKTDSGVANQFAAMPSVHVGWALLVGLGVVLVARGAWRWLALAHPALTLAVVTVTANHYWSDGIVAALLVVAALAVTRGVRREAREPVPQPPPAGQPATLGDFSG
jgi:PAP2 superfamily